MHHTIATPDSEFVLINCGGICNKNSKFQIKQKFMLYSLVDKVLELQAPD